MICATTNTFVIFNLVGYQNITLNDQQTSGGFTYLTRTLPAIGKDKTILTLGDFTVASTDGLAGQDSVNIHTYGASGLETGNYSYLDQAAIDNNGFPCEPGWYEYDSINDYRFVSANDALLPFGTGVMIISDYGAEICCAGEVMRTSADFELNNQQTSGGFTYLGNCSPVNITLKDIAVISTDGLAGQDSVNIHTYGASGLETGNYSYLDQAAIDNNGFPCEPGWYEYDSISDYSFINAGNTPIASGEMFMVISDYGATISIPAPIPTGSEG